MAWLAHLIFLNLFQLFRCDCVLNHETLEEVWEKKLQGDITKGYKWGENPNGCNATVVKIKFEMIDFEMDSTNDIFTMNSVMMLVWNDARLKWKPEDYGGVRETMFSYFSNYMHWIPFVHLNNKQDDGYAAYYDLCKVDFSGEVMCSSKVEDSTECATKMTKWPYDTQECTLNYTISEMQKNIHLTPIGNRAVGMMAAGYGPEFTIVDYRQVSNTSSKVQLSVTFVLDRNGDTMAAILIFPAILLSVLTASHMILDVNDRNRLLMVAFSMFCHFYYLTQMKKNVPKQSPDTPTILVFYRSSLILTFMLVVASVVLMRLRNRESAPPSWVSSVYSVVLNSHGKYFIWPRWKTNLNLLSSEDVDVKAVDVWNGFANILNSVCFFIVITLYAIMIPVCIPRPQPFL